MSGLRIGMIRFLAAGLVFFSVAALAAGEDFIKIETSVSPLRLSRGEEGKVLLKISVRQGMTINSRPSFVIEFGPNEELVFPKNFFTASDLAIEAADAGGRERLELKKSLVIPFTVSLRAKRGVHTLEGRVKYFATSDTEGWCRKSSTKFSATYSTRLTVAKKNTPGS
jgi:hypothetical protein